MAAVTVLTEAGLVYRWTASCCHSTHSQEMLDRCPLSAWHRSCLLGTMQLWSSRQPGWCIMLLYLVQHMVLHCLLCVARCRHDWGLRTDQSTWLVKFSIPNHNTWYYIALTFWSGSTICPHTLHPASALCSGSPQLHLVAATNDESCTYWAGSTACLTTRCSCHL